jgi:hypothetical protein
VDSDEERLKEILETMKVPRKRKKDYLWLMRNLGIENKRHAEFDEVMFLVRNLYKKNYRLMGSSKNH